jgi:hypothetical protein
LSAHKTKHVFEFLQANPTVRIHYTPTYSSWLNQACARGVALASDVCCGLETGR